MSMLANFLAITNYENPQDISKNQNLFAGLEISKDTEFCQKYMGKYPVIFLSLKDIIGNNFNEAMAMLVAKIFYLYKKYRILIEKNLLSSFLAEDFTDAYQTLRLMSLSKGEYSATDFSTLKNSLLTLTNILNEHFGQQVVVIIDEYDVPVEKARNKFYDQMLQLIRDILAITLKSNDNLYKGFLTGCLRITKESVFTGWNNFNVYDVQSPFYSTLFGFTIKEVEDLLSYYDLTDKFSLVKEWYDGYVFYNQEIYNPWSVLKYIKDVIKENNALPQAYWIHSSANELINEFISKSNIDTYDEMENLLQGGIIKKQLNLDMNFRKLDEGEINSFWSMLYLTGYLTQAAKTEEGNNYTLKIPNKEIMECFKDRILNYFTSESSKYKVGSHNLIQYLAQNDVENAQIELTNLLKNYIGIFDINKTYEYMYHMFLNGIFVASKEFIENPESFKSNEESGDGRADIKFIVNKPQSIGIVIEIKRADNIEQKAELAQIALKQYKDKEYYRDYILEDSIKKIYIYGIAFYKRSCTIVSQEIVK